MNKNSNNLVEIFPNQVIFDLIKLDQPHVHLNANYILKANLTIFNLTDEYIIYEFKINKENNTYYTVDPPISILSKKENKAIIIRRYCEYKSQMNPDNEKFQIKIFVNKEKPEEENIKALKLKLSNQAPSQIIKIKIYPKIENILEFKGNNLIDISPILFDSVSFNYKFNISNLTNNSIFFEIYENFKNMNYISERRYLNPKEIINCIFQNNKKGYDKEIEKIMIIFYSINKIIKNNEEAFQIFDLIHYYLTKIQIKLYL